MLFLYISAASAAIFNVNSTADATDINPGNGVCATASGTCTLRAAIVEANNYGTFDFINVPSGFYALTATGSSADEHVEDLDVTQDLAIWGSSAVIDASGIDQRVMQVHSGAKLELRGLTLQNGTSDPGQGEGGGIMKLDSDSDTRLYRVFIQGGHAGWGGGIYADNATLYTEETVIALNNAIYSGGGVYTNGGVAQFTTDSTIGANTTNDGSICYGDGGGISVAEGAVVDVADSELINNAAGQYAGAVYVEDGHFALISSSVTGSRSCTVEEPLEAIRAFNGSVYIDGSSLNDNSDHALMLSGSVTAKVRRSAFYDNDNSGIWLHDSGATLGIEHSTFARNGQYGVMCGAATECTASHITGTDNGAADLAGDFEFSASVLDSEAACSSLTGTMQVTSSGDNVYRDGSDCNQASSDQDGIPDALLSRVSGPAGETHHPLNPAQSASLDNTTYECDPDQLNVTRPALCDSGAIELTGEEGEGEGEGREK